MEHLSNKKKVLFLITKGNLGGAQRYVFDLATELPREDFETTVGLGEGEGLEEKLQKEKIKTIRLKNSRRNINPFRDFFLFFELLKLYKKEKPDIIHLNSSKIGFLGSFAAYLYNFLKPRAYRLKPIFTAHGWAFNDSKFLFTRAGLKFLQWLTVLMSDKTIAVSQKTKNDISGLPLVSSKIKVIRNGVGEINFLPREEARKKLLPEKKSDFWIGCIAELHKNKGVDILIDACEEIIKKNPKVCVAVLGEGEERKFLEKKIKEKGIENSFFFTGFKKEAAKYLKAFDVFVLPSRTEGLPYVLLEAGLAAIPTVASNVGGIPEIIEDKKTGLLAEKGDRPDLAQKLKFLIKNPKDRQILGEKLKESVQKKFRLESMINSVIMLYNVGINS